MPLTGAIVRSALAAVGAVGKQIRSFDELADGANTALRQASPGLTPAGAASFLATCAQESAYFRTTREYGTGQWYAPWIGRSFVQVTHKSNYRALGVWCYRKGLVSDPEYFVENRDALQDYRWAWTGGLWYFQIHNLWRYANDGNHYAVSQGVNRGPGAIGTSKAPLHWTDRKKMFDAFLRAGDALLPNGDTQEDDLTPEQDRMLREVYAQMVRGTGRDNDPKTWGWPGWAGGTGEHLTVVDMLRRLVVEVLSVNGASVSTRNTWLWSPRKNGTLAAMRTRVKISLRYTLGVEPLRIARPGIRGTKRIRVTRSTEGTRNGCAVHVSEKLCGSDEPTRVFVPKRNCSGNGITLRTVNKF